MGVAVVWQVEGAAEPRRCVPQQDQRLPGSLHQQGYGQDLDLCVLKPAVVASQV